MQSENHSTFIRGKIVAICEAILNEEIGVICGSRRLCALVFELHVGRTVMLIVRPQKVRKHISICKRRSKTFPIEIF
jgi:hypothetical protein